MTLNTLNFEAENFVVDYITFKFQALENSTKKELAYYLSDIGFNCYQQSAKSAKPVNESLVVNSSNKFQASIIINNPYWPGTLLQMSGSNSNQFYSLAKQNKIDWKIFNGSVLSRIDIYYCREYKTDDEIEISRFLEQCYQHLLKTSRNVVLERNNRGLILTIGNRASDNFARIYQITNPKALKFEYEIKGKFLFGLHHQLVNKNFNHFEDKVCSKFIRFFAKILPLQHHYVDWLVLKLRPIRKRINRCALLKADYLENEINMDTHNFVKLIKFINYAQQLDYRREYLGSVCYRQVIFKLRDFLQFTEPNINITNSYKFGKLKDFFKNLQKGLYVKNFSQETFQSLVLIPQIEFTRNSVDRTLVVNAWLVDDLFYYSYPFYLPDFFDTTLNKAEFELRFWLFKIFATLSLHKIVIIDQFFTQYSAVLNTQRKAALKRSLINLIFILAEADLIEPNCKIIDNGNYCNIKKLTTRNISKGFIIYEKIYI